MTGSRQQHHTTVVVVDFGAQYAQVIARRVREAHVFSLIVPSSIAASELKRLAPAGIILSGGPKSVHEPGAPTLDPEIYDLQIPILGICYGAQLIAQQLGGIVANTGIGEYGRAELDRADLEVSVLLKSLPETFDVWMSHRDSVQELPYGFRTTARTSTIPMAAFEDRERGIFAVQFHPEVTHTHRGQDVIKAFLYEVCACPSDWTSFSIIEDQVEAVRAQVGGSRVICALSGGVDSAVAAALVHKAIGDQLTCIFVDTGLMRRDEATQVEQTFRKQFHIDLHHLKESDRFLGALAGVADPEKKRKIIGTEFIRVFEAEATKLQDAKFLVQGTLYPDVIESGHGASATIKTHHNVGGLPEDMALELVEPLRDLFKDEVREMGYNLGLPEEIVQRQPFPGPGLAVRIIGEVDREKLEALRAADAVFLDEIRKAGLYGEIWQSFAVLPDIRTVGVMGDERTYGHPIILRAVTSEDAMTADWYRFDHDFLDTVARRIVAEVPSINRVTLDITSKPPGTIEWE